MPIETNDRLSSDSLIIQQFDITNYSFIPTIDIFDLPFNRIMIFIEIKWTVSSQGPKQLSILWTVPKSPDSSTLSFLLKISETFFRMVGS